MSFLTTLKNWFFGKIIGGVDVDSEIYVSAERVLIISLVIHTRFGDFHFPLLNKQLPEPQTGYVVDAVAVGVDPGIITDLTDRAGHLGLLSDVDEDTRPA